MMVKKFLHFSVVAVLWWSYDDIDIPLTRHDQTMVQKFRNFGIVEFSWWSYDNIEIPQL